MTKKQTKARELRARLKRGRKALPANLPGTNLWSEEAIGKALGLTRRTMRKVRTMQPERLSPWIRRMCGYYYDAEDMAELYGVDTLGFMRALELGRKYPGIDTP